MLFLTCIPLISCVTASVFILLIVVGHPLDKNDINWAETGAETHPLVVDTVYGPVLGLLLSEGVQAYLGIPYAKPPVGELRWYPPVEPTPWAPDLLEALQVSPGCPQNCFDATPEMFCPRQVDEDCLYLNIWSPRDANPSSNLPVILFIHGGSYNTWSASAPLFDGRYVTEMSNVIFVNFNYRLGTLGWLKTEGEDGSTGNYGLMDQRAAMKFVQENIRNFGGNPERVTLNGQSAGAQAITLHMTNPATDTFFHQVIIQSNPITIPLANISEAIQLSTKFSAYLNCTINDIVCLRNQSVDNIIWAQEKSSSAPINDRNPLLWFEQWGPVIDGIEILQHPLVEIAKGNIQHKPIIIGDVTNEIAGYIHSLFPTPPPQIAVLSILAAYFGRFTLPVLREYWTYWNPDIRPLLIELGSDYIFVCSSRNMTRSIESFSNSPVYHYVLNHTFSDTSVWTTSPYCETPGVTCHDTDLFFTLYSLTLSGYNYSPSERRLAQSMMSYWANFVHSGDPNNFEWQSNDVTHQSGSDINYSKNIFWHRYLNETGWSSLYFQTPLNKDISNFRQNECDLLDLVGYNGPVGPLKLYENELCEKLRTK
ncbi:cAMP-regulated D2 protein-like [Amphiura filiformis]|uniref:cAMP-regulated D2 protein-like n=1 Tax=Amphiura filiformis TaxID=82378 RepID=UPI003B2268F6